MPSRFASRERTQCAIKNRESRRLARPRKRHYTFARRRLDHVTTVRVRHGAIAKLKALICRVYLFVRNGNAATGSVVVRLRFSLPSSIG